MQTVLCIDCQIHIAPDILHSFSLGKHNYTTPLYTITLTRYYFTLAANVHSVYIHALYFTHINNKFNIKFHYLLQAALIFVHLEIKGIALQHITLV